MFVIVLAHAGGYYTALSQVSVASALGCGGCRARCWCFVLLSHSFFLLPWPTAFVTAKVGYTGAVQVKHCCLAVPVCYLSGEMARGGLALRCWSGSSLLTGVCFFVACLACGGLNLCLCLGGRDRSLLVPSPVLLASAMLALDWTCPVSPGCWSWPVNVAGRNFIFVLAQSQRGHSGLRVARIQRLSLVDPQCLLPGAVQCGVWTCWFYVPVLLALDAASAPAIVLLRVFNLLPAGGRCLCSFGSSLPAHLASAVSFLLPHVYCAIVIYFACTLCWVYLLLYIKPKRGCVQLSAHILSPISNSITRLEIPSSSY